MTGINLAVLRVLRSPELLTRIPCIGSRVEDMVGNLELGVTDDGEK